MNLQRGHANKVSPLLLFASFSTARSQRIGLFGVDLCLCGSGLLFCLEFSGVTCQKGKPVAVFHVSCFSFCGDFFGKCRYTCVKRQTMSGESGLNIRFGLRTSCSLARNARLSPKRSIEPSSRIDSTPIEQLSCNRAVISSLLRAGFEVLQYLDVKFARQCIPIIFAPRTHLIISYSPRIEMS